MANYTSIAYKRNIITYLLALCVTLDSEWAQALYFKVGDYLHFLHGTSHSRAIYLELWINHTNSTMLSLFIHWYTGSQKHTQNDLKLSLRSKNDTPSPPVCPTQYACCSAVVGWAELWAGWRTRFHPPSLAVCLSHQHHAVDTAWRINQEQFTDLIMWQCNHQGSQGKNTWLLSSDYKKKTEGFNYQQQNWLFEYESPVCVPMSLVHGWLLQLWLCRVMPSQSRPPFLEGGAEQVLFLCLTPPPHWASHSDHSVHSDQWPSTTRGDRGEWIWNNH